MADMTVTGWVASDVRVVRSDRPWGAHGGMEKLVRIALHTHEFGAGLYPSNGIPAPMPSHVGLRRIDYIIPVCPFADRNPVTNGARLGFAWGVYHPSVGASGATSLQGGFSIRMIAGVPKPSGSGVTSLAGAAPSHGQRSMFREFTTNISASQISATSADRALIGYAIFGEF